MKRVVEIVLSICLICFFALPSYSTDATKWKKNMLLIYIPEHEYALMMNQAFGEWQGKIRQKMQFYTTKFVKSTNIKDNDNLIDINVNFRTVNGENAQNTGSTSLTLGRTGSIRKAEIYIYIKEDAIHLQDVEAMKKHQEEVYSIMLQQVGKSLGLTSSQNPQSVMCQELQEGQTILSEDIESLYNIYNWAVYRPLKSK